VQMLSQHFSGGGKTVAQELSLATASLAVGKSSSPVLPAECLRLGEDLRVRKSGVQVLSPAGTFLEGGCSEEIELGHSFTSSVRARPRT
jgi:hypothetical protein